MATSYMRAGSETDGCTLVRVGDLPDGTYWVPSSVDAARYTSRPGLVSATIRKNGGRSIVYSLGFYLHVSADTRIYVEGECHE